MGLLLLKLIFTDDALAVALKRVACFSECVVAIEHTLVFPRRPNDTRKLPHALPARRSTSHIPADRIREADGGLVEAASIGECDRPSPIAVRRPEVCLIAAFV